MNGKYWGIHNVREKVSTDFLLSNHGAEPLSTDLLYGNGAVKAGNNKRYSETYYYFIYNK